MQLFLQQIVEGLASGAIYASLALALVLIYRATRIVNFAQGEMATLSVYMAWQLTQWGVPFVLSLIIVAFSLTIFGTFLTRSGVLSSIHAFSNGPVGTIFLAVCLYRAYLGHFTPRQHFGFEAAAWYWHFVDVVWLFLFVAIYVWGGWGAEFH